MTVLELMLKQLGDDPQSFLVSSVEDSRVSRPLTVSRITASDSSCLPVEFHYKDIQDFPENQFRGIYFELLAVLLG